MAKYWIFRKPQIDYVCDNELKRTDCDFSYFLYKNNEMASDILLATALTVRFIFWIYGIYILE